MAYARGRLYVPVVELCSRESAVTTPDAFARSPAEGKGVLYALDAATGKTVWRRPLAAPPFGCATVARDAVVVPTYDGHLAVFDARTGRTVWRTRLADGNNSCPAVGEDVLVVGAGAPYPGLRHPAPEVVAFAIRR
jgi:outer membrane protein assembly factor BamB